MSEVNREERLELVIRRALPLVGQLVVHAPSSLKKLRGRQAPAWVNEQGNWGELLHVETERAAEVVDWLCEGENAERFALWREMREATGVRSNAWDDTAREGTPSEGTIEIDEAAPEDVEQIPSDERQATMYEGPETGEVSQGAPDFEGDPAPEPERPDRRQNRRKRPKPKEEKK